MIYRYKGLDYLLHLVDTPGHVDFRAEVTRSYASCGGALLLVDASQGIQAQTVANFYYAFSLGLGLIPVVNKIDLPTADVPRALQQLHDTFELDVDQENSNNGAVLVSAKTGKNVEAILPAVIERIPPPVGDALAPAPRILLVDSWYDNFRGVVLLVRVFEGTIRAGDHLVSMATGFKYTVGEVGIQYPEGIAQPTLRAGQVGYVFFNPGMKKIHDAKIGDTFTTVGNELTVEPYPGFEEPKPMVFVAAFPTDQGDYTRLSDSIQQLTLNDRSITLQKDHSEALGAGWRLGFLGSLHCSVFQDRLRQEHGASVIITEPAVPVMLKTRDGTERVLTSAADFPDADEARSRGFEYFEPFVSATITVPEEYLGRVITLCENSRGEQQSIDFIGSAAQTAKGPDTPAALAEAAVAADGADGDGTTPAKTASPTSSLGSIQVILKYSLPSMALVDDLFGKLKGVSRGYATLDYEDPTWRSSDLVKLQLLVNKQPVDAISRVMHRSQLDRVGRHWVTKFKEHVDRQMFEVIIQATAGRRIVARETIKPFRKDVLAKLHASDITRRQKLLSKQKAGRKRLTAVGNVTIEHTAFQKFLSK